MKRILTYVAAAAIIGLGGSAHATAPVTGQWDFDSGDLSATVGTPLAYLGTPATTFTTMTINGQSAKVMGFPGCDNTEGYIMTHGIAPNGGPDAAGNPAVNVNQYTLIMDIMFPAASSGHWRTFLQTDLSNSSDATMFANPANGIGNYGNYAGYLAADTWYRVAFVVDLSTNAMATGTNWSKYIDGQFVGYQGNSVGGLYLDGSFSLQPTAYLFTDNDGDTAPGFVSSIQVRDGLLTAQDIQNLGGPTAAGIPIAIPTGPLSVTVTPANQTDVVGMASHPFTAIATLGSGSFTYQWYHNGVIPGQTNSQLRLPYLQSTDAGDYTVVVNDGFYLVTNTPAAVLTVNPAPATYVAGQWDFNQTNSAATYGQPLLESDPLDQVYDTTTSLGISDIAGQPAHVMECYATTTDGYIMTHGIAPNGGGTNVNQYTLIMDLMYPSLGWASLWQTDPSNISDGDIFFNASGGLGISGQYDGALTSGDWHRVVVAFDLTRRELGKYIDGTNVVAGSSGLHNAQSLSVEVDGRWSLLTTALFLADNDHEIMPVYVSSVQIRSGRMTDAAVAALGAPTAYKIPGFIKATSSGGNVVIDWTGTVLESAPSVTGPWSVVSGAAHPHTITSPTGKVFFKAAQQ